MPQYSLYGGGWIEANYLSADSNNTTTFATAVTSGGTTTLTSANYIHEFTGSSAQTVTLPSSGVTAGQQFMIINNSTGTVTVQSSASAVVDYVASGTEAFYTALTSNPTTAAHWEASTFYNATTTITVNTVALRDGAANITASGFVPRFTTAATSGGTTSLSAANSIYEFTGTSSQTVTLPSSVTAAGQHFTILNNSTGTVTVQSSAPNTIVALAPGTEETFTTLVATPTTAAHWRRKSAGFTSPSLTTPTLSTATPASASATGTTGTVVWDADYIYICTATNTWKRAAIATW